MSSATKHSLKREYVGKNEGQIITPTCSCGWRGRGEPAYNDFQMTNVKEQENEHLWWVRDEQTT